MKKWFMRAGLQKRLIVSVMAVFCLPLLLIAIYILSSLTGKLRENAVSSANNILDSAAQEMTYTLSSLKDTASFLAMDSKVCVFLSLPQDDADVVRMYSQTIKPFFTQLQILYPSLRSMRLLHNNSSIFYIRDVLIDRGSKAELTAQMKDDSGRAQLFSIRFAREGMPWGRADERNVWYIDYCVPPSNYLAPTGIVELVVEHHGLWNQMTRFSRDTGMQLLLAQDGQCISATEDSFAAQWAKNPQRVRDYTIITREISSLGMTLYCGVPASITSLPPLQLLLVLLAMAGILVLTFLLVRWLCARQLTSLNALTARIDAISPDASTCDIPEPMDEIDRLSKHFDHMYQRLGESFQREKRLLYDDLTNQLKPHFICNAMDMLRLQAQHYQQDQLAESILQINQYFRYSMLDSGGSASLGDEIDNAVNYMRLVNVMREDKILLNVALDAWAEQHASTAMLPKMLLQPLLENAVRHGIKLKKNAYIGIQLDYQDPHLIIQVTDNGAGMDEEMLAHLNQCLSGEIEEKEMEKGKHIGLLNVTRRLRLLYPNAYTIRISSLPYQGTTVTLRLLQE